MDYAKVFFCIVHYLLKSYFYDFYIKVMLFWCDQLWLWSLKLEDSLRTEVLMAVNPKQPFYTQILHKVYNLLAKDY